MTAPLSGLKLEPLSAGAGLRRLACDAIMRAITEMDIYTRPGEIWLDERKLSQELGVSRTPIREALGYLEQRGLVRSVPRRGIYVVRKTKREIVEMTTVWAAVEGMAARLAAARATDGELEALHALYAAFEDDPAAHLCEYSQANMAFHKAIIRMGGCILMTEMTDDMFLHMRAVRAMTMGQGNRAERSVVDHRNIVDALKRRDPDLAERLVREHTLGLAAHVEKYGDALDAMSRQSSATAVVSPRSRRTSSRRASEAGEPAPHPAAHGAQPGRSTQSHK